MPREITFVCALAGLIVTSSYPPLPSPCALERQPSILLYMWRTFVWPGVRVDFKGQPVDIGPDVPDEPWFYDMQETYSTKEDFVE